MYDIIIIGGGPGGLSTAYHAASEGLNVLVLEEHENIGEPVHCGECLSKTALQRMNLNPPQSVFSRKVSGVKVISGEYASKFKEDGFVLDKNKFEQWLADNAASRGAEIKTSSRVESVAKDSNWIVKTKNADYNSKVIVDATGVASIFSKKLLNQSFKTIVGLQYLLENIEKEDDFLDFYLDPLLAPHGYLWIIPKGGGRANVGLTTNDNSKAKIYLDSFLNKMGLDRKPKLRTFGGLIPISGPQKTFSNSFLAVGDAAGFTSPLFEGGTHLSLKSGQLAAKAIKTAVVSNDFSEKTLSAYETDWKAEFPDYSRILKGKEKLYSFSESDLKSFMSIMPKTITGTLSEKLFVGLKLVMKPSLIRNGALEIFKAFSYSKSEYYGW